MSQPLNRSLGALAVSLALAAGACGDKQPHRGWTGPFDVAAAEALVAKCLPGAKPMRTAGSTGRGWRLADPGREGWLTFGIAFTFHWKDEALNYLAHVALDARGPKDQQTPDNSARFRAALNCAFAGLPMPPKVGAKALELLAAIRPPGELTGKRDGFDLTVHIGSLPSDAFYSPVIIFGE